MVNKSKPKGNILLIIPLRYFLLFLISICAYSSTLFYNLLFIFTIYPLNFILNIFLNSSLENNLIIIGNKIIEIIPACVAVSAYVFLFILNISTPMSIKTRIKSLSFAFFSLLLVNILRLAILSYLFISGYSAFDVVHKFTWYFLSIILVIVIWFSSVKLFKIKNIPVYTDINALLNQNTK
ncbi:MAG: pacearchaeosortase [archaeon]|nr:pacearchaeosortase [archaeon]